MQACKQTASRINLLIENDQNVADVILCHIKHVRARYQNLNIPVVQRNISAAPRPRLNDSYFIFAVKVGRSAQVLPS